MTHLVFQTDTLGARVKLLLLLATLTMLGLGSPTFEVPLRGR
jgi:hypothetical protein